MNLSRTNPRRFTTNPAVVAAVSATLAGITGAASAGTFTPIPAVPGSDPLSTGVLALNDSDMVGGSYTTGAGTLTHGFIGPLGGSYTTFDYSGTGFTPIATRVRGMDNAGDAVGYAQDASGNSREFLRSSGGTITTLVDPSTSTPLDALADGINSAGYIVGNYHPGGGGSRGFILSPGGATLTKLADPSAAHATAARGINNTGTVVGWYVDAGLITNGFVYTIASGTYTTLDDPLGVNGTYLRGINDSGEIAGAYVDASNLSHGFIYDPSTHVFTPIDVPGSTQTFTWQLNNLGQLAVNSDTTNYVWSPGPTSVPEPPTLSLLGLGLAGLAFMRRRKAN
jgi:hypothetical protein